jgi:hypothetical protein
MGRAPAGVELLLRHDNLGGGRAAHRDATCTYADGLEDTTDSFGWMRGMDEVVNALTGAGLNTQPPVRLPGGPLSSPRTAENATERHITAESPLVVVLSG